MPTVSLEKLLEAFTPEERSDVDRRTAELVAEELTLRDLRRASHLTQERLAEILNVEQETISRLERRADLLISTLSSYVEAMGGKLHLVAEFPNRKPVSVILANIVEKSLKPPRTRRSKMASQENVS
jgi:DNA-binding XRE family transcriptional regulator